LVHPELVAGSSLPLRSGGLQSQLHRWQPCGLLMVQGVTPAHKGLAPSRLIIYLSVKKRCPYWAHTAHNKNGENCAETRVLSIFIKVKV